MYNKKMTSLNIVELIERSPLTRLNKEYEHRFIEKVRESFTEDEQHMFLASFYMYLNYDPDKDFVVDFEFVWKYLEFARKENAKRLLEKHFFKDIDYQIFTYQDHSKIKNLATTKSGATFSPSHEPEKNHGGCNKEFIYLSVNTFKKFCLYSDTKKSHSVHNYYIKLETLIQQTLDEETQELRDQLKRKDEALMDKIEEFNKLQDNHKRILYKRNKHNMMKGSCFYIIKHNEIDHKFKFGISKDLNSRLSAYRTYDISQFLYIVYTEDNKILEDCVSRKYRHQLTRHNSEWICNVELNDIIQFLDSIIDLLELETKKYTNMEELIIQEEEEEEECTSETPIEDRQTQVEQTPVQDHEPILQETQKKCNKCMLILSKSSFNKDKNKKDGLHSTCRLCEKETKKQYLIKKREIMEQMTEKQCKICNEVKEISHFSKHLYCQDGYVSHCHECIQENCNNKRRIDRENNIRYTCGRCGSNYSRKDVLVKHQRLCMT